MSTDDNSNNDKLVDMDDLDAFENEFFEKEPVEDKAEEKSAENEDDPLAAEEDKDAPAETGDEDEEEDEDEGEDEESEPEPEPKPKPKSKAQQRIEKLLERERLANERAEALEQRLAALETRTPKEEKREEQAAPALRDQLPEGAPNPDAVDKEGNPVYPLGEFDPRFIRDITKFTIDAEMRVKQEREQQEAQAKMVAEQQRVIQENWLTKLEAAEEEIPDIREDISDLVDTFKDVEPSYGEYLASVIMSSDVGPQLMHYLSQNIGEAQKIVASGPAAATLALGRLEARLTPTSKEEKRNASTKRVSEAPRPPEARTRGAGGKFAVPDDTDDLDAFERKFFKK